jgi:hypothetical protein
MIKRLGSKQKYTLTREIKKTMKEGFHDGFIWGTMLKIKKNNQLKQK